MSFYPIRYELKKPNTGETVNQPAFFLIPGVHGDSREVIKLAQILDEESNHERDIYVFHDERLRSKIPSDQEDIEILLSSMVKELCKLVNFRPYPFCIVGYSYGGALAAQLALRLKAEGHEPHLIIIDAPSPTFSQKYFNSGSPLMTLDLLHIVNAAAGFSGLNQAQFSEKDLAELAQEPFSQQYAKIIASVYNLNQLSDAINLESFRAHINVAEQNLSNLYQGKLAPLQYKLPKINILMTEKTDNKYGTQHGNWDEYAHEISSLDHQSLKQKEHTELLKEKNCVQFSSLIINTFNEEVNLQEVFQNALNYFLTVLQQNHPTVSVSQAAKNYSEKNPYSPPKPLRHNALSNEIQGNIDAMDIEARADQKINTHNQFGLFAPSKQNSKLEQTRYHTRLQDLVRSRRLSSPTRGSSP